MRPKDPIASAEAKDHQVSRYQKELEAQQPTPIILNLTNYWGIQIILGISQQTLRIRLLQ
jgi:flagellar assembly factor FliW